MEHTNILIVGAPGTGKTWVMCELLKLLHQPQEVKSGLIHYTHSDKVAIIGKYDGSIFQGSDKLSMAVMREIPAFLISNKQEIRIFEGDRFTNKNFLAMARPWVVKILGDGEDGRKRRGSQQTERQIKSLQTRNANFPASMEVSNAVECFDKIKNLLW